MEELSEISVSKAWVVLQVAGAVLQIAVATVVSRLLDVYIPPAVSAYRYGIMHYFLVRGVMGVLVLILPLLPVVLLMHPAFGYLTWTLGGVYVLGPLWLGADYWVLFGLCLVAVPIWLARVGAVRYVLTDRGLVIVDNWVGRERKVRIFSKFSDVVLHQSLAGKILGYGSVIPIVEGSNAYLAKVVVGTGVRGLTPAPWPDFDNSLFNVPNPERVWRAVARLVKYRDLYEIFEHFEDEILEGRSEPPPNMYV